MRFESYVAPLFVPATRSGRFEKAANSGTDAVIIDLEDAVSSEQKSIARDNLRHSKLAGARVLVRLNDINSPWFDADIGAVTQLGLSNLCLPKVNGVHAIDLLATSLGPNLRVLALIETAEGLASARSVAAHPNVVQLAFGPADFFLDLGSPVSTTLAAYALAELAVASRAANKPLPLDGPAFSVDDPDSLARECGLAQAAGAGGKLCIHPSQVPTVLEAFAPSEAEVQWAKRIVLANENGSAQILDGQMIDAPIVARARRILSRANQSQRPVA